jgi:hypothetical protein
VRRDASPRGSLELVPKSSLRGYPRHLLNVIHIWLNVDD